MDRMGRPDKSRSHHMGRLSGSLTRHPCSSVCGIISPEVSAVSITIKAHFDGKTFVPDEPVDLPAGEQVEIIAASITDEESQWDPKKAKAALRRFRAGAISGLNIPDEALRRENLYEDRL
jgi:hypothetical protein